MNVVWCNTLKHSTLAGTVGILVVVGVGVVVVVGCVCHAWLRTHHRATYCTYTTHQDPYPLINPYTLRKSYVNSELGPQDTCLLEPRRI